MVNEKLDLNIAFDLLESFVVGAALVRMKLAEIC